MPENVGMGGLGGNLRSPKDLGRRVESFGINDDRHGFPEPITGSATWADLNSGYRRGNQASNGAILYRSNHHTSPRVPASLFLRRASCQLLTVAFWVQRELALLELLQ